MDLKKLREICDNGCHVTNIFSMIPKRIAQHTVRTKGQFFTQRLFYIREGETEFVLNDGGVVSCKKGDIVYLPPDITYESHWSEAEESAAILIRFDLISEGVPVVLFDEIFVIAHDPYGEYLSLFLQLHTAFERGLVGYKLKCQSVFLDLLHLLAHQLQKEEGIQKTAASTAPSSSSKTIALRSLTWMPLPRCARFAPAHSAAIFATRRECHPSDTRTAW